jgi:RsiW-degrading membrane proteinase PrsW (M82 family)
MQKYLFDIILSAFIWAFIYWAFLPAKVIWYRGAGDASPAWELIFLFLWSLSLAFDILLKRFIAKRRRRREQLNISI